MLAIHSISFAPTVRCFFPGCLLSCESKRESTTAIGAAAGWFFTMIPHLVPAPFLVPKLEFGNKKATWNKTRIANGAAKESAPRKFRGRPCAGWNRPLDPS
jgi:hypothetical protein